MDLIEVLERFPDQEACIEHLEKIRWNGEPRKYDVMKDKENACPACKKEEVKRRGNREEQRLNIALVDACLMSVKALDKSDSTSRKKS